MNDKEMTKLAAKVVGIHHPGGEHSIHNDGRLWDCRGLRWWNPLHDSGQCFEMAYKSGVDICFFDKYDTIEEFRRAIVEAVAKIGERMINA